MQEMGASVSNFLSTPQLQNALLFVQRLWYFSLSCLFTVSGVSLQVRFRLGEYVSFAGPFTMPRAFPFPLELGVFAEPCALGLLV